MLLVGLRRVETRLIDPARLLGARARCALKYHMPTRSYCGPQRSTARRSARARFRPTSEARTRVIIATCGIRNRTSVPSAMKRVPSWTRDQTAHVLRDLSVFSDASHLRRSVHLLRTAAPCRCRRPLPCVTYLRGKAAHGHLVGRLRVSLVRVGCARTQRGAKRPGTTMTSTLLRLNPVCLLMRTLLPSTCYADGV